MNVKEFDHSIVRNPEIFRYFQGCLPSGEFEPPK